MNLLIIKDDKPGHYNQTEGLVLELKEIYSDLNVEYIEIEIKSKITRKILRFLLNNFSSFFQKKENLKYLSFFYKKFSLPLQKPDLIISTGGNTSNFNAWLKYTYNCKNILNGALRGLKEELFTYITTVIDLGYKNQIILDVAPSLINKKMVENKTQEFILNKNINANQIYYTLLIGGDGSGYKFDNSFYETLSSYVKKISNEKNVKWLITTSRRTPVEVEKYLEEDLKDYYVYFVAYNKKPEQVLLPFLGISTIIYVTEESSSMISESISARKPVITLSFGESNSDNNYRKILEKFVDNKQIYRLNLENNKSINISNYFLLKEELNIEFKKVLSK